MAALALKVKKIDGKKRLHGGDVVTLSWYLSDDKGYIDIDELIKHLKNAKDGIRNEEFDF